MNKHGKDSCCRCRERVQMDKQQQFQEEINTLCAQIKDVVENYKKLSRNEKKIFQTDMEQINFMLMGYVEGYDLKPLKDMRK